MKQAKYISDEEMNKRFPELMKAVANPKDAMYCNYCDGLRLNTHECIQTWQPWSVEDYKAKYGSPTQMPNDPASFYDDIAQSLIKESKNES